MSELPEILKALETRSPEDILARFSDPDFTMKFEREMTEKDSDAIRSSLMPILKKLEDYIANLESQRLLSKERIDQIEKMSEACLAYNKRK